MTRPDFCFYYTLTTFWFEIKTRLVLTILWRRVGELWTIHTPLVCLLRHLLCSVVRQYLYLGVKIPGNSSKPIPCYTCCWTQDSVANNNNNNSEYVYRNNWCVDDKTFEKLYSIIRPFKLFLLLSRFLAAFFIYVLSVCTEPFEWGPVVVVGYGSWAPKGHWCICGHRRARLVWFHRKATVQISVKVIAGYDKKDTQFITACWV